MERSSQHGPRIDDEMEKEVQSLVTGSPVEARVEPERLKEDAADGEPDAESVVGGLTADAAHAPAGQLPHEEARARSDVRLEVHEGGQRWNILGLLPRCWQHTQSQPEQRFRLALFF